MDFKNLLNNDCETRNEVIKLVKIDAGQQSWNGNNGCKIMVKVDHNRHTVDFCQVSESLPDFDNWMSFVLSDKDIQKELLWAMTQYKRVNPIFWDNYLGMSGCRDICLKYAQIPVEKAWACGYKKTHKVAFKLHITCFGKMEDIPCFFSGDLAELVEAYLENEPTDLLAHNCVHINNLYAMGNYPNSGMAETRNTIRHKNGGKMRGYKYLPYHNPQIDIEHPICGCHNYK